MNFSWTKKLLFLFLVLFITKNTEAQTSISGIINDYAKVTAIDVPCNNVTVSSATGFSSGAKVLLIQMQGATLDNTNTATFGDITAIGNAGNYEFNEILTISGNIIYLTNTLLKSYTSSGSVQLITIPQYTDVNITGTLMAKDWDGSTGGVLVFQASGTVTLNADINVSSQGFRGGIVSVDDKTYGCTNTTNAIVTSNNYFYTQPSPQGGQKGEGIGIATAGQAGKGKQGNGGGGGNGHNSGGAGGGNYGSGGRGGDKDSRSGCTGGCGNALYPNGYGLGAVPLNSQYNLNKVFMGGGGGGGHEDDHRSFNAGDGGGIVIITANTITNGGSYSIMAQGDTVQYSAIDAGDGNSGGGAGGAVLLSVTNISNTIPINVSGGKGGDTNGGGYACRYFGPGGGGGGGIVWLNSASANVISNVNGGANGYSYTFNGPYGATSGGNGTTLTTLSIPQSSTVFAPPCVALPVSVLSFSGKRGTNNIELIWNTINETNNDHFIIEKSFDGINFSYLTNVTSQGNNNSIHNYSYTDNNTNFNNTCYYRLKQYDVDGKESTLGYVKIENRQSGPIIDEVFPNPFNGELILQSSSSFDKSDTQIQLLNLIGQELYTASPLFDDKKIILNTTSLAKGVYLLKITTSDKTEIRKVIKE